MVQMTLWKSTDAAGAAQGEARGSWTARRVVIDSRIVQPDDVFVALAGERFDGHDYVAAALAQGAAAAMVSHVPEGIDPARLLVVADTMTGLEALARAARSRSRARVAAITGSVGKTSAKEMLKVALNTQGGGMSGRFPGAKSPVLSKTHATAGNYNNHIGVPLTLANLPREAVFAVIEMGMNHAGEITPLTRLARPHAALITAVEAAHMEFFDSLEAVAAAKCEICAGLEPGGTVILPADSPHLGMMRRLAGEYGVASIQTFGRTETADYRLVFCRAEGMGMVVEARIGDTPMQYRLSAVGEHFATLSVGTLGAVKAVGGNVRAAAEVLQRFREPEGRGNIRRVKIEGGEIYLIDDSYNASPVSMRAAIAKLALAQRSLAPEGRKIAVLGEMLELGAESPAFHAALAGELEAAGVDQVFVAGELMAHLYDALPPALRGTCRTHTEELLPDVLHRLRPQDTVLVKGSHGSHIHRVVTALKEKKTDAV